MKPKRSFFLSAGALWSALLLQTAGISVFHAFRMVWVFYDPALRFLGGAMGLFLILLVFLALNLILLTLRRARPQSGGKLQTVLAGVCFCFGILLLLAACVMVVISGFETNSVMLLWLKRDLPMIASFGGAVFLLLALPAFGKKGRLIGGVCFSVLFAAVGLWQLLDPGSFRILNAPLVLDTGSDYAVVFATNKTGTACVEYTFEGETHTVYAQIEGRRVADRLIHAIHVPYAHLKNNSYQIGATRVKEEFSYGSRLGASVKAGPYTLHVNETETQRWLVISDWHTHLKKAKAAIAHLEPCDAVILLGDPAAGMDFEEQAVQTIVCFGGDLTGGEKPVLYVRGNHETRGAFADDLPGRLGLNTFYYTAASGPYAFLALDSGEDKPDDHIEYGALDDYASNRKQELAWLQTVSIPQEKLIVLTHAWQFSEPEPDISRAAWDTFSALGARFVLSGHAHTCEFPIGKTEAERAFLRDYPNITPYIDGGFSGKTYTASLLTLSPQGARFEAVTDSGERVLDKTLPW